MSAKSLLLYFTLLVFFALGLQASAETDVLDCTFFYVSLRFTMNLSLILYAMLSWLINNDYGDFGGSKRGGSECYAKLLSFYVW